MCMEGGDTTQIVMFPLSIKSFLITVSTLISNHTTEQSYSYDSLLLSSAARRTVMTSLLLEKPLSLRNDLTSKQPPHVHDGCVPRTHWNPQICPDGHFWRPAAARGAGKSTYTGTGFSALGLLRGNSHTTAGPHREGARGAAHGADGARLPQGDGEPPPPHGAGRSGGEWLSQCPAIEGAADIPTCPSTTYPKTPPSSHRGPASTAASTAQARRPSAALWRRVGGGRRCAARSGGGSRPSAQPWGAVPRTKSKEELFLVCLRISRVTCSRFYHFSETPECLFPPASQSFSVSVVLGLVPAASYRQ